MRLEGDSVIGVAVTEPRVVGVHLHTEIGR